MPRPARSTIFNIIKYRRMDRFAYPLAHFLEVVPARLASRRSTFVPYMPVAIYFDVTTACNLRCEMCALHTLPKREFARYLSFDNFKKILDQVPCHQMRHVEIPGRGEPLLNPDLTKMLSYARERGFTTALYTNGTLIDENNVKDLVMYLDRIHFSVDGAIKETYEGIRKGADFDKVMDNISMFIDVNKTRPKMYRVRTYINFVCSKLNYSEIVGIINLAHKLQVNAVTITMARKMYPGKRLSEYDEKIRELQKLSYQSVLNSLTKAYKLSEKYRISFSFQPLKSTVQECVWPWVRLFVTYDGFVVPCCLIADPSIINFGNVFHEPLKRIWNNSQYQKFRRELMSKDPPTVCARCGL